MKNKCWICGEKVAVNVKIRGKYYGLCKECKKIWDMLPVNPETA